MTIKGSCLCGGVTFEVTGPLPEGVACHCGQCRKNSGHYWASVHVPEKDLKLNSEAGLSWYSASDIARRGFCQTCGSTLFWNPHEEDKISISLGALEAPTGTVIQKHIFTADKGDYYSISDGLKQS